MSAKPRAAAATARVNSVLRAYGHVLAPCGLGLLTLIVAAYFAPRGFNSGFVDLGHDGYQLREVRDLYNGGLVFRDTFDQYGPLGGYLNLMGFLLLGKNLLAMKYFVAIWYAVTAACLYAVARQFLGIPLSAFAILLWIALAPFYQHGIMLSPHAYTVIFQAGAILLMFRYLQSPRPWLLACVGGLAAMCCLLKQPYGAEFLFAMLAALVADLRFDSQAVRRLPGRVAILGGSFAVVLAAALGWVALRGGIGDWYRQTLAFPLAFYVEGLPTAAAWSFTFIVSLLSVPASFLQQQYEGELHWLLFRAVIIAGGVLAWRRRSSDDRKLVCAAVVTAGLWLGAFPSGNFMHQWWTLSPTFPVAVYVVRRAVAAGLRRWHKADSARLAAWAAVALVILVSAPAMTQRVSAASARADRLSDTIEVPYSIRGIRTDPAVKRSLEHVYDAMTRFRGNHPGAPVISIDAADGDRQGIAESLPLLSFFDDNYYFSPIYWNLPALSTSVYPAYRAGLQRFIDEHHPLIVDFRLGQRPASRVNGYYILAMAPSYEGRWVVYAPEHAARLAHGETPEVIETVPEVVVDQPPARLRDLDTVSVSIDGHAQNATVHMWPPDAPIPPTDAARWISTGLGTPTYVAKELNRQGQAMSVNGQVEDSYSYLLHLKEDRILRGQYFFAKGTLTNGGLTIGLQSNDQWVGSANVEHPGPFVVLIAAPTTGAYSLTIANLIPPVDGQQTFVNAFRIESAGWVQAGPLVQVR